MYQPVAKLAHRGTAKCRHLVVWFRQFIQSTDKDIAQVSRRKGIALGIFAACLIFGVWLVWNLITAKSQLEAVRTQVLAAKSSITAGDTAAAQSDATAAHTAADKAHDALASIPCRLVAAIPVLGAPVDAARGISDTVSAVTDEVLPDLLRAGEAIDVEHLRLSGGGLDLDKLSRAQEPLEKAVGAMGRVRESAAAIPDPLYAPPVADAREKLREQVAELDSLLVNSDRAAKLAPPMLGASGDRSYFIAFQTNAELRGTGGLIGGSALLRASGGHVTVDRVGSNREFGEANPGVDLGQDFDGLYGSVKASSTWFNANMSPHFPYAAQIWQEIVRQNWNANIDGVIAVDPVALSYVLSATGPVTLPTGEKVTSDNVVRLTESELYDRYPTDQMARKEYLTTIAATVLDKLASGGGSLPKILESVGKAAGEHRVMVWSSHADEEKILEQTTIGHVTPQTDAPYANVAVINSGPSKLDYYLRRQLRYTAGACNGARRDSQVGITLNNTAPGNLPDYVSKIEGFDGPSGTNIVTVFLYATDGAELKSMTLNGTPITDGIGRGMELGHPVFYTMIALFPNEPTDLVFNLSEPTAKGTPTLAVQPLVQNGPSTVDVPAC